MAIVPRYFEPSVRGGKRKARVEGKRDPWIKLMIGGGREGPEVGRKPIKTKRVTLQDVGRGSPKWSEELESGKTLADARTQPPFLRDTRLMELAYRQGVMPVSDALDVAKEAMDYANTHPGYVPRVEYTSLSVQGGLASVSGKLQDPDVDTLSQEFSSDWVGDLSRLAADIRAVETTVRRTPAAIVAGIDTSVFSADPREYVGRVYLNMERFSIPVQQLAILTTGGGKGADALGVYSPSLSDPAVKYKGVVMQPGQQVRLPVSSILFVTFDPPEYRQAEFINSAAFARSRGILIEPDADVAARIGIAPGEAYIVPYSQILRLRMIYPPASGYERKASRTVESVASIQKDLQAAQKRINKIAEVLTLQVRTQMGRNWVKRTVPLSAKQYVYKPTNLVFELENPTFEGTLDPVVVWARSTDGEPPAGDVSLIGRPVTPIDFLRALRAESSVDALRSLRRG